MNRFYKLLALIFLINICFGKINAEQLVQEDGTDSSAPVVPDAEEKKETGKDDVQQEKSPLYVIDTIKVVVFGDDRTDLITDLDCKRPSLDGQTRSQEDLILEELIYQDAARYKMLATDESTERHLMAVQREHNLSLDDLKNIFASAGYTFEEGKAKFGVMSTVGQMLDFKIRSRLIVPEKDIEHYYKEHPVYSDETYQLANALIKREDDQTLDEVRAEIEQLIQTGSSSLQITWSEPFWVKVEEISQNRQFIKKMQPGEVAIAEESDEGIEIIKLMSKQEQKLLTLEERYREIADTLRQPKYEELFNNYRKELFDNASLIYF